MTVRLYARWKNWPVAHIAVDVTHEKAAVEGQRGLFDIFHKTVDIRGAALTPEQHARLIDVAGKCPVHRTLESTPSTSTVAAAIQQRSTNSANALEASSARVSVPH